MARHRTVTPGTTATAAASSPASGAPPRDAPQTSGGWGLKRAALYARVSTEKQEREETVASQVDLLQQTAAAHSYDALPGNVFIDDGVSGTRLDRPALDRLRDLAAEGAGARSSACISPSARAQKNRCCSRCRGSLRSMNGR